MKYNTWKSLIIYLIPLWITPLLAPALVEAAAETTDATTQEIGPQPKLLSFVHYSPKSEDFYTALEPVVLPLAEGIGLLRGKKNIEEAKKQLLLSISRAEALLGTLPRGNHDELLFFAALAYDKLGKSDDALRYYELSLEIRPNNPAALFRHAYLLFQQEKFKEAIKEFNEVKWRAKNALHEVLFFIARCQLKLGMPEKAMASLEESLKLNSQYIEAAQLLIESRLASLEKVRDPKEKKKAEDDIVTELQRITKSNPNDRNATLMLIKFLLLKSDPLLDAESFAKAESLAELLVENSKFEDDEAVKLLFDSQLRRGKIEEAKNTLQLGLQKNPDSARLKKASRQLEIENEAAEVRKEEERDEKEAGEDK